MNDRADIYAQVDGSDLLVGRLFSHRRRNQESASFEYADDWLASKDAYSVEPALPLRSGQFHTTSGQTMFGAFADSAPDRWGRALIQRREANRAAASDETARSLSSFFCLLNTPDDTRQGALRYRVPGREPFLKEPSDSPPRLLRLPKLLEASERFELDHADDEDLLLLLRAGSSLGGARPKTHVLTRDGRLAIAKFPSVKADRWDVMAWETVAHEIARRAGVVVPRAELMRVAGRHVLVIDRFDRAGEQRIGYISAMTMLEAIDGEAHSYLEIAEAIETWSASTLADLEELWRRMALSMLLSNTDDHLRNHGFLLGQGGWRLSPAFDINPTPTLGPKLLSTAIDDSQVEARVDLLLGVREAFRLSESQAREILGRTEDAVSGWRSIAADLEIDALEITSMEPAFEHEQREVARRYLGR